jgi:hypothetical protein
LSDRAAVEASARRTGRNLEAEGVAVLNMGGASNISHFLSHYGPPGLGLRLGGLYDQAEVGYFRRGLERVGLLPRYLDSRTALARSATSRAQMEEHGFFVCVTDLEDELIRALGAEAVLEILRSEGELGPFETLQHQPAHRERPLEQQLHRFLGTRAGRKIRYGRLLVEALDPALIPRPLTQALAHV